MTALALPRNTAPSAPVRQTEVPEWPRSSHRIWFNVVQTTSRPPEQSTATVDVHTEKKLNSDTGASGLELLIGGELMKSLPRPLDLIMQTLSSFALDRICDGKGWDSLVDFQKSTADAISFASNLNRVTPPHVSANEDGEVAFQWMKDAARLLISFEGDGRYGYAMLKGGAFAPGKVEVESASDLPEDLNEYLVHFSNA